MLCGKNVSRETMANLVAQGYPTIRAEGRALFVGHPLRGAFCCAKRFCRFSLCDAFFCYPLPIPPSLDKSSSVCTALDFVQLCRHPADFSIQSRNAGKGSGGFLRAPTGSEKFRPYDCQSVLLSLPIFVPSRFATQHLSPKPISMSIYRQSLTK